VEAARKLGLTVWEQNDKDPRADMRPAQLGRAGRARGHFRPWSRAAGNRCSHGLSRPGPG
jgi:hypothetical protein